MNNLSELKILAKNEVEVIEKGFACSSIVGGLFFKNSIFEFKRNLQYKYENFVPSKSKEYGLFILVLLNGLKDEYKELAINELSSPDFSDINTDEIISLLGR